MVVISKLRDDIELPIIDLANPNRLKSSFEIVKASEEYGFFKVTNHGVPKEIIARMDQEAHDFFSKPRPEKQRAGPPDPYGYGCKNIGFKGDVGQVEYLLLQTNTPFISRRSKYISNDPNKFSYAVIGYISAVRELACEILDMMLLGLGSEMSCGPGPLLSGLISDPHTTDSALRLNHYPIATSSSDNDIGFGEHTDPQILTLLRSNGVGGLQISTRDGAWVPVSPHPESAFCVNVGDVLQAMTNGRFLSVKHRAVVNEYKPRTSVAYFAAPSLDASISCLPGLATSEKPPLYRGFTWGEYKKASYTLRLGDNRLNLFKIMSNDHDEEVKNGV